MTIFIAGGAGFIGSHLTDKFIENNKVIVADLLIFGKENLRHLEGHPNLVFYETDLSIQENVDKIFDENRIDMVYHMAANSDIQKGGREPDIDFHNTLLTTRCILEAMRKHDVKNLFFASTSAVYGEMPDVSLNETTGGLEPVSYYGGAKLASEALISSYTSMCDLNTVIFRFPNVIGPRLTHGVIFDFIRKLRKNPHALEILGDGSQCKPYIYVLDLVDAITRLTKDMVPGISLYNISILGEGTTVTRIAEIVTEEMGLKNVDFQYTGGARGWKGDVPRFTYDISRVLSTGWKPEHTSEEAVRETVKAALEVKSC